MTEEEIDAFLQSHWTLVLGTQGNGGFPHLVTTTYGLADGEPVFTSYSNAQKIVNLRRDRRCSCLVEDGDSYSDIKGVLMYGHAELVEDRDEKQALRNLVLAHAENVRGEPSSPAGDVERRTIVRVRVERTVSWDFSRVIGTSTSQ